MNIQELVTISALRLGVFNRHKPRVVTRGGVGAADVSGKPVERYALGAGDGGAWHICYAAIEQATGVGCKEKKLSGCASIEIAPRRLVAWRETVRLQRDEWKPCVEGCAGDLLFAGADAGRYEDCSMLGRVEESRLLGGQRVVRNAARALDLQAVGAIEQEWIPVGGAGDSCNRQGVESREVVGVCAAHGQSAWVVADVAEKGFQLAMVGENAVVVAGREEGRRHVWRRTGQAATPFGGYLGTFQCAMAYRHFGTYLRQGCGCTARRHSDISRKGQFAAFLRRNRVRNMRLPVRCRAIYGAISLGTPGLEASHYHAEMTRHAAAHEQQPVKMIGHHCIFQRLHVGMKERNLPPAVGHGFAERREVDSFAHELPQQRESPRYFKCDHVNASARIVVAETAAFHGMDDLLFHTCGIIEHCFGDGKLDAKNVMSFFKGRGRFRCN